MPEDESRWVRWAHAGSDWLAFLGTFAAVGFVLFAAVFVVWHLFAGW